MFYVTQEILGNEDQKKQIDLSIFYVRFDEEWAVMEEYDRLKSKRFNIVN